MTTDELNTIVAAVVAELEKSGVDFDYKAEQAKDDDLVFVIRGTAPDYQGKVITWKGLLDIITAKAEQAKNDAVSAKTDAVNAKNIAQEILTGVQNKGTEITNFVATSKAELETQKNESVNAVKSVYQTDLNELKGDLDNMNLLPLKSLPQYKGFPYSTKKWGNINELYKHSIIPVKSGYIIEITGSNIDSFIAFFTDYNKPIEGQAVPYSSYDGFNDRIQISISTKKYVVPEDVNYLFVLRNYNGIDVTPNLLKINHFDLSKEYTSEILEQALDDIKNESVEMSFSESGKYFDVGGFSTKWELGTFRQTIGYDTSVLTSNNIRQRSGILEFPFPITIFCDKDYGFNVVLLDENELMTGYANGQGYLNDDVEIKAYQKFRLVMANQNTSTDISGVDGSNIVKFKIDKLIDLLYPNNNNKVRWCAMGDSITEGYISYNEEPYYKLSKNDAWAYKLAKITGWELTNKAIGGTGFVRNHPNSADAGWNVAKNIDFTQFDFVTIAYGVNDWKYNCTLGTFDDDYENPTTIYGAMRSTIETIIASNPLCKIFIISPVNCSVGGNEGTNWGIGYSFSNNGTLEQIYEAEKTVAEYYGIEFIDMLHNSIINRKNIKTCLIDNVHPSADTHTVMAHEIGGRINWY